MSGPKTAAVFGKLPAHGDFVARGLTAEVRAEFDDWLSASLAAARETLGADFADRFDAAAPWLAEGDGIAGAIAPSQDAAGRRYPVLLLRTDASAQACEELLYRAITEGWDVDTLAEAEGDAPIGMPIRWFDGRGGERAGAMPADLLSAMLA